MLFRIKSKVTSYNSMVLGYHFSTKSKSDHMLTKSCSYNIIWVIIEDMWGYKSHHTKCHLMTKELSKNNVYREDKESLDHFIQGSARRRVLISNTQRRTVSTIGIQKILHTNSSNHTQRNQMVCGVWYTFNYFRNSKVYLPQ